MNPWKMTGALYRCQYICSCPTGSERDSYSQFCGLGRTQRRGDCDSDPHELACARNDRDSDFGELCPVPLLCPHGHS